MNNNTETDFNLTENYAWVDELLEARYAYEAEFDDSDAEDFGEDIHCCYRCNTAFLTTNDLSYHLEICTTMSIESAKELANSRPMSLREAGRGIEGYFDEFEDFEDEDFEDFEEEDDKLFNLKRRPKDNHNQVIPMEIVDDNYLAEVARQLFPSEDEDDDEDEDDEEEHKLSVMSEVQVFPMEEDIFEQDFTIFDIIAMELDLE